jgi:hypothetical protein
MIVVLGSEGGLGWWRAVAALGKPARAYFRTRQPGGQKASNPKRRFGEFNGELYSISFGALQ